MGPIEPCLGRVFRDPWRGQPVRGVQLHHRSMGQLQALWRDRVLAGVYRGPESVAREVYERGRREMSDPGFIENFVNASAEGKIAYLEARLNAALAASSVHIDDDSAAHAGHAGASAGSHYTVTIVAARFARKPRVARHRLGDAALSAHLRHGASA